MEIELNETENKGSAIAMENGVKMGETTYSKAGADLIIIDHTDVEDFARGKGVGRKLLDGIVKMAREKGVKIMPLCPYAKSQFDKDQTLSDVLFN